MTQENSKTGNEQSNYTLTIKYYDCQTKYSKPSVNISLPWFPCSSFILNNKRLN